ncbi:HdeD family acid-resistance protein [Microbacterium sp. 179-B 1A2 NHS]|uniref:HdeD family acid-resistance protein n=1 Tax=Microbacterium sp. 179-B 1A2 NHS TaxID=3142383 RepID=UPI00399F7526
MADTTIPRTSAKGARLALIVGGVLAALFGIAILVWPTKAAVAVTALIAVYAVLAGIVYLGLAFVSKTMGVGGRIGHALLGVLYVVAGILAFTELQASAAFLAVFITLMVGILWIVEGFVSLFSLGDSGSKALTAVFAIISVLAGVTLVSSPIWGVVFLWWFLGISLVILGVLNAGRAIFDRTP